MTSPEYQAPTWVNEDDPDFLEGVSPDLGAGYLNQLSGAVEDHGQRLGAITPVVTNLQNTALDQATGDNRYILQSNANGFAPAEATATALAGKQPLDADLTALAGLDSATAGTVASDGAGWVKKTYAQLRTALGLATIATSGKLGDATDLTTTGTALGKVLAPTAVSGGVPTAHGYVDLPAVAPSVVPVGRVAAWCGSSTFNGAGSTDSTRYAVRAVTPQVAGLARTARYQESIGAAVDGDTSAQLLARFDAVLAQSPGLVIVNVGGNDASQDVPRATFAANIIELVARARRAGRPIVLTTITPRASGISGATTIPLYNLWLSTFAQANRIPLADFYGALVDPATGYSSTTYAAVDGVHINNAGHAVMANVLSTVLRDLISIPLWLPAHGIVTPGLVTNPLCTGGSGSALPTNWFLGAGTSTVHSSFAAAPVNGDGLIAGQWAGLTVDNTAGGASVYRELRTGNFGTGTVSEGDRLRVYCQVKTVGYFAETGLRLMNNATAFASPISVLVTAAPGPVVFDATAPAAPTQLRVLLTMTIPAGQTGSCYLGACNVYNLTTGGLVGIV